MNAELKKALLEARKALKKAKTAKAKAKVIASQKGGKTPKADKKASMSSETRKSLGKWGVTNFSDLCKVNTAAKRYRSMSESDLDVVKDFKESVDIAVVSAQINKFTETEGESMRVTAADIKATKYYQEELSFQLKAFGIDSGDEGFEWIPTIVSSTYIDEYNLDRKVSGLFAEVRMPSNPYRYPVLSDGAIARKVGAVTALSPAQVFNTSSTILFEAVKMTNQYELPEELNEDSAPDIVKAIRMELMEGQEKAMEIAILEGDADGTHMHNFSQLPDVAAGTLTSAVLDSPEHFFDGLRKRALQADASFVAGTATVDAAAAQLSETELSSCRGLMGKFGVDPSQLALIGGPKVYNQMLNLDDVRTLEQYGAKAPVITGELAKYEGMPVIVSEYLREDTAIAGLNTAIVVDNIKLSVIMVNRKRFYVGLRRPIQVKIERNRTQYDVLDMVSFCRKAFQGVLAADGSNYDKESSVALIYNIAK